MDKIGMRDVEAYKAAKLAAEYEAKTVNNHLGVLRKMLRTAVDWNILEAAPTVKPLKAVKPEVRFLAFNEAKQLIDAAEPEWRTMIVVALNTGLRLGELLALRWKHVDLDARQLVVCENDWRGIIGTPKGHKARVVPLNNPALVVLESHVHRRGPLVFCRQDGSRLTFQQCRRPLLRTCKVAGVKDLQWHALRHTFASHMVMRGVPLKAGQELLGHATMEMTLRYSHLTPDARRSAVDALDESLAGHGKPIGAR